MATPNISHDSDLPEVASWGTTHQALDDEATLALEKWKKKREEKEETFWREITAIKKVQWLTLGAVLLAMFAIPIISQWSIAKPG